MFQQSAHTDSNVPLTQPDSTPTTTAAVKKSSQIKFLRPAQMALFAKVTTYPPLGQVTIVPPSRKEFEFTVVIESSQSLPEQPWEVSIWYDHGTYSAAKSPWRALDLARVDVGPTVLYDERTNHIHRYTFEGSLPSPFPDNAKTYKGRKIPFTVRYRTEPNSEWMWMYENFGVKDGELILQPPLDPNFLGAGPVDLVDGWFTRKLPSEAPDARLYSTESSMSIPVHGDEAKEEQLVLGKVLQTCRWMALIRIWSPWLAPRHGESHLHLTEPAILLSFLRNDGLHVVLLAVNGIDDVLTTFKSDDQGNIVVSARNDTGKDRKFRCLAATAWTFEVANAAVMYEMRRLVRSSSAYEQNAQSLPTHIKAESVESDTVLISNMHDRRNPAYDDSPTPQWLATWYDSLAYCTWNSLGQDLNADKIMAGLESLAKNKIHIANLIIDDNWQSLTGKQGDDQFHRGWTDFEANPIGFPEGLKKAVSKIREAHPRIKDIAVWHALMGYWGCVSPDKGHLHKDYKIRKITMRDGTPAAGVKYVVDDSDIHKMYDDFYTFLSDCGVTAVKTDVQFYLDLIAGTKDRRDLSFSYQSAWTQAHLRHLAGKAISCMSQTPQIMYHSFLPTNTPRIMLRNSDDFFPDVPTSHPWHIFTNAHAALFVQHLNVLPDWDMFQTSHPYSGFHAAGRCISGGPIYITDTPGQHDVDLIHQMTALNPRGDTIVLRPSNIAKSLNVYEKYDEGQILKVGVYDGKADVGTGMIGVFNIAEHEVQFAIPVTKIPGVIATAVGEKTAPMGKKSWIVRSHMSRRVTRPIAPTIPVKSSSLLQATLSVRGYDIWSALPVQGPFNITSGPTRIAILGLLGKMTGCCAILGSQYEILEDKARLKVTVQLKALGTLGIWVSDITKRTVEDNLLVMIQNKVIPKERVSIVTEEVEEFEYGIQETSGMKPGVIHVDVEGAWNDLDLDAGYSNEVAVQALIS